MVLEILGLRKEVVNGGSPGFRVKCVIILIGLCI